MTRTNRPVDSLTAAQPDRNATVSASAGTGKTWLLVTRIIRLLLADAEPASILALTFTRKAAAEMQMRLQERLYQLATADDKTVATLLLQTGSADSRETIAKSRDLYEHSLHANFPVRLQTFHSFCQDILSHFPLEAGITPGFELLENTALIQQMAWEELFAEATRDAQGKLANDLDVLMQACNGPANTRAALNSMLTHRSDWWAFTEHSEDAAAYATERLQEQLQIDSQADPYRQFLSRVSTEQLRRFADLSSRHPTKTNLSQCQHIERALNAISQPDQAFSLLQPVFLTARQTPRARKPSKVQAAKMGSDGEAVYLDLHAGICAAMLETLESVKRAHALRLNAVWYRAGQRYIERYQQLKHEQRVLDFTDLEWNCYRLLTAADNAHWVQYKIDQRINHVLIDEFQDTNPTQWQLITPLLAEMAAGSDERPRSFFIVGDEKQSIYSFRRANPALQQRASDYLAQNMSAIQVHLDASRRSSPAVIDTVNTVFRQDQIKPLMPEFLAHSTHLEQLPGRVSLFPLSAPDSGDEQPAADDECFELRNPLLAPRPENTGNARFDEAMLIADQIEKMIDAQTLITAQDQNDRSCIRPIEYSDIMILLRNRTHMNVYESVLRDRGIPFTGSQRGSLLDNQEIQDLERLLDSLITPFNNLSIAQVLKSPIFAATDTDLTSIARMDDAGNWYQRLLNLATRFETGHPLKRAATLLSDWRSMADTMPVHDLLDRIYAEGNIIQRYVFSVPASQRQRVRANLHRFHELSLELDSGRYPSLSHFLHYLRSVRGHSDGRPDEPTVTHGQSCVNLMTIHASKGLEAPVVILADCDNQGKHNNAYAALVEWPADSHKPTGFQLITSKQDIDQKTAANLERRQLAQQREELNLLYVAVTRARQYLLVTGSACRERSGWHEYIETAMKTLVSPEVDGDFHYETGRYQDIDVEQGAQAEAEPLAAVDSRLTHPIHIRIAAEQLIAPSHSIHDETAGNVTTHAADGALRGIVIHRALDLLSRTPALTLAQTKQRILQESAALDPTDLDSWLAEADSILNHRDFALIFKPAADLKAVNEMPLLYRHDNRIVHGQIDRLIIGENQILLIDYKTHQVRNPAELDELATVFGEQMRLYCRGAKQLWPERAIKSGLLFTSSARLTWLDSIEQC